MQETQETQVQLLGGEDPLEEEMATHSSILSRKVLWTDGPGRVQFMVPQELDTTEGLNTQTQISLLHTVIDNTVVVQWYFLLVIGGCMRWKWCKKGSEVMRLKQIG